MKRIVLYIGVLFLLCLATVGAARLIGKKQPVALAVLFTNPDGSPCVRPCLLGIRPGETKYTDAIKLLESHPFMRGMRMTDDPTRKGKVFRATDGSTLSLGVGQDTNGIVELIDIETEALPPLYNAAVALEHSTFNVNLGQVVTVLGIPDYFQLADDDVGRKISYSYYDHIEIVTTHAVAQQISVDDKLLYLFIQALPTDKRADMQPWNGFGNLQRYFEPVAHN